MPDRDAEDACAMSDTSADDLQKAIQSACDAYETDAETDAIKHFCAVLEQAPEPAALAGNLQCRCRFLPALQRSLSQMPPNVTAHSDRLTPISLRSH